MWKELFSFFTDDVLFKGFYISLWQRPGIKWRVWIFRQLYWSVITSEHQQGLKYHKLFVQYVPVLPALSVVWPINVGYDYDAHADRHKHNIFLIFTNNVINFNNRSAFTTWPNIYEVEKNIKVLMAPIDDL